MTSGILLVDKPVGPTSHDVVARIRRAAGTRRVGHAGTLDPAASGLLLVGVDGATRLLTYLVGLDKTYEATIRLGLGTTTDDAEGEALGAPSPVDLRGLDAAVAALTGEIDQVPSAVSAIHVAGRRAHELVRAGEHVDLPARRVTVGRFSVRQVGPDLLEASVDCSSGTYIRALARDLGAALGCGGHLTALRRTRVGPFDVTAAQAPDAPLEPLRPAQVATALFPHAELTSLQAASLRQGKRVALDAVRAPVVAAIDPTGGLIGLVDTMGGPARVLMNLPTEAP